MDLKACTRCKRELPRSDFYRDKRAASGLRCWCKACMNEIARPCSRRYQKTPKGKACSARSRRTRRMRDPFVSKEMDRRHFEVLTNANDDGPAMELDDLPD